MRTFSVNMVRCADDELAVHVPSQLKQKIWEHKYINIALLLKGNAELAEIFSGGVLHVSDGKVEARPKQTKEKVNSIEQWTEAFLIFMSIYLSRYPGKTQELLKYISVIRDAAVKFPNYAWRHYDEQFRVRQAEKVANWGKINSDLWLRTMPVSSTTFSFQPNVSQFGSCRDFNNKGFCNGPCMVFAASITGATIEATTGDSAAEGADTQGSANRFSLAKTPIKIEKLHKYLST